MKVVLITALSTGGSGGEDRLIENITLNFSKVSLDYVPQDGKGGTWKGDTDDLGYRFELKQLAVCAVQPGKPSTEIRTAYRMRQVHERRCQGLSLAARLWEGGRTY
jgi:hypothetical protein